MKKKFFYGLICFSIAIIHSVSLMAQLTGTKTGETDFASKSSISWQSMNNNLSFKTNVSLDYASGISNDLTFRVNAYKLRELQVNMQKVAIPELEDATYILKKGAPELPKYVKSLIIPDQEEMHIEVVSASYMEVKNIEIAPSKGNLLRNIDPKSIPYIYGKEYKTDEFFPGTLAELGAPYILREHRGQTVVTYPLQYNPIQKTLRIYTEIKVRVSSTGKKSMYNTLSKSAKEHSSEFENIYKDHFINYKTGMSTYYTPLNDNPGNMLIICYGDFMDEMADFVNWKRQKGIPVEIVNVSAIGGSSQIKTYVTNYYNTNGLTYLLLVGDNAQVPTSTTSAGASDNNYGYIVGNDHYSDIFVGRFSAETEAQVTTMADRTIHYERDVATTETWMGKAIGSASSEGSSNTGDDAESDAEHINNIETDLENYGYTVTRVYQSGGTIAQMSNAINAGTGLINYCGHGSETSWGNVPFNSSNVNALTNNNKLPFIMDVACQNGAFTNTTCFAEAWLRATNSGEPTGAIGIYASTINQDWAPPMRAQDEFVDILTESYSNNIKRTFSGAAMNGIFDMIDHYGSAGSDIADTWTLFGDPSFVMRTKQPTSLTASHPSTISATASTFTVGCSTDGALVSLTSIGEIVGTKTVSSGSANVSISGLPPSGTMKVTVTAYNKTVYTADVAITGGVVVQPVADFSGSPTTIPARNSVQFTDLSTNSPTSWAWTFEGGTPSTSTSRKPFITYSTPGTYTVTLTVANSAGSNTMTKTGYITVEEAPLIYCNSGGSYYNYEWISNVEIGSFSHASAASSYSDFTNYTVQLSPGQQTTVNLTPGFGSGSYREFWEIWIDYNIDGDFDDDGENVFSSSGTSAVSGSFTVSNIADTTRMRVSMKFNGVPAPCESFSYGETEDYSVVVASSIRGNEREMTLLQEKSSTNTVTIYPNPVKENLYIQTEDINAGMKIINAVGAIAESTTLNGSHHVIDVSALPVGVYTIIINTNGNTTMKKFIKQ
jgi:gingipain R